MKKTVLSLGIAGIILGSSISMAFSDVKDTHWAKEEIDAMTERGIISGYTDGTFRPSRELSKIEAIILLSKVAGINKYTDAATYFEKEFSKDLENYSTKYKSQVSYLLGVGVLTKADLEGFVADDKANTPISREEMAVLVTRALGKEDDVLAKSFFVLPFTDASSIKTGYKAYVEFVYNEGIMKGVTENTFSPKTSVTRAQMAIILNDIIDRVNIKPVVPEAEKTDETDKKEDTEATSRASISLNVTQGNVTAIDTLKQTITINKDDYKYSESTLFYVDDERADEYDVEEGMELEKAVVKDGLITSIKLNSVEYNIDKTTGTVKGEIISINITSEKVITLEVDKKEKTYLLTSSTKYYKDDVKASILDFETGDIVTATVEDGEVTKIVSGEDEEDTDSYKVGTIKSVSTSNKTIKVVFSDGEVENIYLASTYKILDSDDASTLKIGELSKGDKIVAFGKYKSSKYTANVVIVYYE
ncbi:MAG: S-layer homology domain-containing protein [Clostridia bacterium]|nr:S-layer homology domain-containing protein [Clostridia bacterium]